ncbi:MAG TPA: molybdenum cofactor biosynthesis protein B [Acidimicrobiales bacterium]
MEADTTRVDRPVRIAVLTVSDSRTIDDDTSGDTLVDRLVSAGHALADRQLVGDDIYAIRAVASAWITDPTVEAIITTGGTGLTGRDGTPEAIAPLLDKEIEGFGEMFRFLSYETIGVSTLQSRALAGVANSTFVFCLPGSTGACKDGWDKLIADELDIGTGPCNLVELMGRLDEQ